MQVFTYEDYIKAIHTFRLNAVMKLAEDSEQYIIKNSNDKLIKDILKNTKEMADFLNAFIPLNKKISKKQLILYEKNRIKLGDSEILYKMKNDEVFFLVCHYSKNDNNFPYKLLNLCIDIIQEWTRDKKMKEIEIFPKVIPIIIYTGKEIWNFPKKINTKKLQKTTYGENRLNLSYNLVDLSKTTNWGTFFDNFHKIY